MNKEYLWKKLGPIIQEALLDATVIEIMVNADGNFWILRQDGLVSVGVRLATQYVMAMVQAIAQYAGLFINENNPSLICSLPFYNARISMSIPPMIISIIMIGAQPSKGVAPFDQA